jgi:hypothetical protein
LKVLTKPVAIDQPYDKSLHTISSNYSIRVSNLCTNAHVNTTYVVFVCLTNTMGDGPLSFARYFHLQMPAPVDRSITFRNVTVISSNEIFIEWTAHNILSSMAYRIQCSTLNRTDDERTLIVGFNETSALLTGLTPFTVYVIMINTFNIHGNGPVQQADPVRTNEDGRQKRDKRQQFEFDRAIRNENARSIVVR